jgi:hypothetical protein
LNGRQNDIPGEKQSIGDLLDTIKSLAQKKSDEVVLAKA